MCVDCWAEDMDGLVKLTTTRYVRCDWEACRDNILQPANEALLNEVLDQDKHTKAAKASTLLTLWRKQLMMLSVGKTGLPNILDPAAVVAWESTAKDAAAFVEFATAVRFACKTLPEIRNKEQRKSQSKTVYQDKQKHMTLGNDLTKRFEMLCAGGVPDDAIAKTPNKSD